MSFNLLIKEGKLNPAMLKNLIKLFNSVKSNKGVGVAADYMKKEHMPARALMGLGAYHLTPHIIDTAAGGDPDNVIKDRSTSQWLSALTAMGIGPKRLLHGRPLMNAAAIAAPGITRGLTYRVTGLPTYKETIEGVKEKSENLAHLYELLSSIGAKGKDPNYPREKFLTDVSEDISQGFLNSSAGKAFADRISNKVDNIAATLPGKVVEHGVAVAKDKKKQIGEFLKETIGPAIYDASGRMGAAGAGTLAGLGVAKLLEKRRKKTDFKDRELKSLADMDYYLQERDRRNRNRKAVQLLAGSLGAVGGMGLYSAITKNKA